MSRHDNLISQIGKGPIFCNYLGFGEQGATLSKLGKCIFICPDIEQAQNMKSQLDALNKENLLVDNFTKLYTLSRFQSNESRILMLRAIYKLISSDAVIISTPQILFSFFVNFDIFKNNIIRLEQNCECNIQELEKQLIKIGYKKVDSVTCHGEFSRRGDILDIFNVADDNPTRLDFFDDTLEKINNFDYLTFDKLEIKSQVEIIPNKQTIFDSSEISSIQKKLKSHSIENSFILELIEILERNEDVPMEFIAPFCNNISNITNLNLPIIISNELLFRSIYSKTLNNIEEKIETIFNDENLSNIYKNNKFYLKIDDFYQKNEKFLVFFDNFDILTTDLQKKFKSKITNIDFNSIKFPNFLHNLEALQIELNKHKDKQIFLCLSSQDTLNAIKKIFSDTKVNFSTNKNSKGIILTDLKIPYNICFRDEEKFYIGSTNFAHKKSAIKDKKNSIKFLPKAGEYVVHSVHGIGKCEGIFTVNISGVDKEFFKLTYRGGDTLYVPYENADCLSLYMSDGNSVTLNKLGGKEFTLQKLKAVKSIEDMSEELLELYAKRKASKGFKYSEDDYLFTEFENSFEHTETNDQLNAIADIKNDMISGKVMDRLICGDVGFGKTEVAMRALFKTIQHGKQVAILAPTTILSLQHCMTTSKRTKDFGISVEMLNRFKTPKEQKKILSDLKDGKINVICGTHRLLSKDVEFYDLGLLILDEEQRFGVKAKEQIKQMKNNVNVLTLSATPIPRTLSMALTSIRDISIINTAPTSKLPVKTYVMSYNDDLVANAINDEINRGGQVLVVYNNIDNLNSLANKLKEKVNNEKAHFDVANGQMSEVALENAIKRLYDGETNVFVSTTLIENGVDLPKANTLIVIDSDKLGLSQMYQLRGRVGRNSDQAYAYFTYPKDKALSEDSTRRLEAIAENTELGSGFKIAMRDLQIRGAGELLGKTQHGHMIKIGYDMYSKLLNETLMKLKGEKVKIERDVKLDIALVSKIPQWFIEDESERLSIVAKISNITSKESTRNVINDLINKYGKLPQEIYHLANIALLKAVAIKNNIKQVTITKQKISIVYYQDVDLQIVMQKVKKFNHFKFENSTLPTINLSTSEFSVQTGLNYIIEFLNS